MIGYPFIWQLWSVSLVSVALELKYVIETNLIKLSYHCIRMYVSHYFKYITRQNASVTKDGYGIHP